MTEAPAPLTRQQSRDRRVLALLLVMVLLAVVVLVARWAGASLLRQRVEVAWAGPPACTGTELLTEPTPEEADPDLSSYAATSTVAVRPGMRCELLVRVTNTGWLPVSLTTATLPYMGQVGGARLEVRTSDQDYPRRRDEDGFAPIDAVIDLDARVAPGTDRVLTFVLTHRPGGCNAAGTMTLEGVPEVDVEVLGSVGARTGSETLGLQFDGPTACSS